MCVQNLSDDVRFGEEVVRGKVPRLTGEGGGPHCCREGEAAEVLRAGSWDP